MLGYLSASGSTEPHGHQPVAHVASAEVAEAGLLVAFFSSECEAFTVAGDALGYEGFAVGQIL